MATPGRKLDAETIARIKRNASVFRLSVRKNAYQERVSTTTVQKYQKTPLAK